MKIGTILNIHKDAKCAFDTIESILAYVGEDLLVVIDGTSWNPWGRDLEVPAYKLCGFKHGLMKSPYRNVALALNEACDLWKDKVDWYCYTEYDVLFASSRFRTNLEMAQEKNVWMLGNDGHVDEIQLPLIEAMLGDNIKSPYYLLGCCQFFHKKFMKKLKEMDFFNRFLNLTNNFTNGEFPGYQGYDLSEHLYPSLCRYFGGNIGVFASWKENEWHGSYEYFPMRWSPEIEEFYPNASIVHPLKTFDHPVREFFRKKRKNAE